ncbi:MAG: tetratricopeptide repeat protein [Acidobacteria bacterium]|nr:tetratricopeptide repeat protein [Acidobacteriota bacterium]
MKALRVTLAALFVFAPPLLAACNRKPADADANAAATPGGSAEQQQRQDGAVQAPSGDARALFDRGLDAYRHDRDQEAVEHFKRAAELSPDFAEAYYRLGLAYNALKQAEEAEKAFADAVKAYERIVKQEPKNSDAFYFLGLCYQKLGKYDEAVKALKEAVKNSPEENDDKYFEMAAAHFKIAQYDESVRALRKTLEINPDHYPAQELLEDAQNGARRMEDFRKRQEQLRRQQNANANMNANSNAKNSNSGPAGNANSAAPPPM